MAAPDEARTAVLLPLLRTVLNVGFGTWETGTTIHSSEDRRDG